jgi:hypothetical protein
MRPDLSRRLAFIGLLAFGAPTFACDVCAVYSAASATSERSGLQLGVAEQFTHFGTLRDNGHEVDNTADQYLDSSITQLFVGYNFNSRVGVQVTLPLIARRFRRPAGGRMQSGSENGPGDLSLVGHLVAWDFATERSVMRFTLLGGVKFPTGNSDRIGEELHEEESPGVQSGIHGHDLALGSGSYDGLVGGTLFWSHDRLFVTTSTQYAIRSRGSFGYRYANELTWAGGPGYFVYLDHGWSVAVQGVFSGETKGKDDLNGEPAGDTGVTALYLGPQFSMTWGGQLALEMGVDVPVLQHNTSLQLLPDVRARGGLVWSF